MGIRKADTVVVADIGLVGIGGHLLNLRMIGTEVQQPHDLEHRCCSTVPIAGAFVAAAILRIGIDEGLGSFFYLGNGFSLTGFVFLAKQDARQPVATDPGIPVHAGRLPPVVPLEGRYQDAPLYLTVYPLAEVWGERVELLLEHVLGPDDEAGGLGIEEVHLLKLC